MDVQAYIKKYLQQGQMLQLASIGPHGPWICTLYFVADDKCRLYWLSFPTRRHSQELAKDPRAAVAIAVKADQPVIGLQAEGKVSTPSDLKTVQTVMQKYIEKNGVGHDFYKNLVAGKNKHNIYCFTPSSIVLFDEVHFKDRQEWRPE